MRAQRRRARTGDLTARRLLAADVDARRQFVQQRRVTVLRARVRDVVVTDTHRFVGVIRHHWAEG